MVRRWSSLRCLSHTPPAGHPLLVQCLVSGLGANLLDRFVSSQWSPEEVHLSINLRELRAIRLGLCHFTPSLKGRTVGVFTDNTMALAYLHCQGGTFLPAHNEDAELLLCWAESLQIRLVPQFIHHGVQERCGRFPQSPRPDHRVRMDVSSGSGVGSSTSLAGGNRPLRHCAQLLPASLLFTTQRPHGGRD